MKKRLIIYWCRRDFRLEDNPALSEALALVRETKVDFLPLFILENYMIHASPRYQFGYPSRIFLSKALPRFIHQFTRFLLVKGTVISTIKTLAHEYEITLFVNDDIYPDFYSQIQKLRDQNIDVRICPDNLTVSKETRTQSGALYSVFTPFKNAVWTSFVSALPTAKVDTHSVSYAHLSTSCTQNLAHIAPDETAILSQFSLNRTMAVSETVYDIDTLIAHKTDISSWYYDEKGAQAQLQNFLEAGIHSYKDRRDFVDTNGTSRMSLALAWGLISSRTIVREIKKVSNHDFMRPGSTMYQGAEHYISELIWREFYAYLFFHNPSLLHTEFQQKFRKKITWVRCTEEKERFHAWVTGKTGYAIVDAAMMELAETGYMHNRSRMIVSSILTKNLGVDWRLGQEYFRAMLVDLDERSNNGGWQWGASVGADPKPIRIFNPYTQAKNYDPHAAYQKKWLSEELYATYYNNDPGAMNGLFSEASNMITPIVPHKQAREEALNRYGLNGNHAVRDY